MVYECNDLRILIVDQDGAEVADTRDQGWHTIVVESGRSGLVGGHREAMVEVDGDVIGIVTRAALDLDALCYTIHVDTSEE